MRITSVLRFRTGFNPTPLPDDAVWQPRYLYFGRGEMWGRRKVKYTWSKDFKKQWKYHSNIKVQDMTGVSIFMPPNTKVEEATEVAATKFQDHIENLAFPWPFNKVGEEGTKEDPNYKQIPALVFNRLMPFWEGYKGACNFTNTVLEDDSGFPLALKNIEENIDVTDDFMEILNRRLKWCISGDGCIMSMPRTRDFPKMNWTKQREAGIHPLRRETNILRAFYDVSNLFVANKYGHVDRRKISAPYCVVPFLRDNKRIVLNLSSDFVTTSVNEAARGHELDQTSQNDEGNRGVEARQVEKGKKIVLPVFDSDLNGTSSKSLFDIKPVDWRINFEETNFYADDYDFSVPSNYDVHTIFLSSNIFARKAQPDRMMQGRGLMYCYGFLVAQARRQMGLTNIDDPNHQELKKPLTVQLAYFNQTKDNLGFLCFQLNTLSFKSAIKNQVWFDGPYDIHKERETIVRKIAALHMNGSGVAVKKVMEPQRISQAV